MPAVPIHVPGEHPRFLQPPESQSAELEHLKYSVAQLDADDYASDPLRRRGPPALALEPSLVDGGPAGSAGRRVQRLRQAVRNMLGGESAMCCAVVPHIQHLTNR